MKKFTRHGVYPTYVQGAEGTFLPCFKAAVAPGESMSQLTAKMRVMSASMSSMIMNTAFVEMEFYYVPLRILWADFPDWIMGTNDAATGLTFPTITHTFDNDLLGEHNCTSNKAAMSSMPLRAAKLIYNEYYLNEEVNTPYDITDDATKLYWKETDGFGGVERDLKKQSTISEETFDIAVDAGTHLGSFSIQDLLAAMREQKRKKNVEFSGDLYVDMLRSMGVSAKSNILQRPEHLGGTRKYFKPKQIRRTDTAAGEGSSYYEGDFSLKLGGKQKNRKFFPEHGLVMGIMRVMPQAYIKDKRCSLDSFMINRDDFFHPAIAYDRGFEELDATDWVGTWTEASTLPPWSHYHRGEEFTNVDLMDLDTSTFARNYDPSGPLDINQPPYNDFLDVYRAELADDVATKNTWAANGIIRLSTSTPVPKGLKAL